MTVPCQGCADRKVGCHSSCEKYKAFREENEQAKAKREEQRHTVCHDYIRESYAVKKWRRPDVLKRMKRNEKG